MALYTDDEWATKTKPKLVKAAKTVNSTANLDASTKAASEAATQSAEATKMMAKSLVATEETAKSILDMIDKINPSPTNEPRPVRLIVNRNAEQLIESVDVIPLVKKG